jgi:hypothetical protein
MYAWLEANGVKLGHSLGARLLRRISGGRAGVGDEERLAGELAAYAEKHPDAAATLTAAVLEETAREEDQLDVMAEVLAAIFEAVRERRRPVVLPGFVTGRDHVAIVDVRTTTEKGEYRVPQATAEPPDLVRKITLAQRGGPGYGPRPRIWLVTDPKPGERRELEREADDAATFIGTNGDPFMDSMKGRALVTKITLDEVGLTIPVVTPLGLMINADTETLPWAGGSDWVASAFNVLKRGAADRDADLTALRAAFAGALSGDA